MSDADVCGLSAVLHNESGFYHLQGVRDQGSSNASQSTSTYGSPLRDEAHFIHVEVDNPGQKGRQNQQHLIWVFFCLKCHCYAIIYNINAGAYESSVSEEYSSLTA